MIQKYEFIHPPLTEHQIEVLTIMIEEASEVQQRATKAMRFGATERQPGQDLDNSERLSREIGDFLLMIEYAKKAGLVTEKEITAGMQNKEKQLEKYMRTHPSRTKPKRVYSDPCPDCGTELVTQPRGGVECPNPECNYWFCY